MLKKKKIHQYFLMFFVNDGNIIFCFLFAILQKFKEKDFKMLIMQIILVFIKFINTMKFIPSGILDLLKILT